MMDIRTLCDIPRQLLAGPRRPDQLSYKDRGAWRAVPTDELCLRIRDIALGLERLGVARGDRVALLSENRPEWTVTDFAVLSAGAATVPIYPTLLPDQIEHLLSDSEAVLAVVSTPAHLDKILKIRERLRGLREIVVMDPGPSLPSGVRTWHMVAEGGAAEAAARPRAFEALTGSVRPDDLASIIYTSGTTGPPKGVMVTHGNFVHNVTSCCAAVPFQASDLCLSILPLSHVYERLVEYCYLYRGAGIAYAESIEALPQNLLEVRPTIVACVPRLFEKMYGRILDRGAELPWLRRRIFAWAIAAARRYAAACGPGRTPGPLLRAEHHLADRLVYRALRERLGGRLRFFVSGSAPLQREIAEFFYGVGILILEGYGLTETATVITVNRPDSVCFGAVGRPIEGVEVRIAEDGEILTRSPSVMKGYFKNEQATREVMKDGWFCTGDIGRFDEHGCLVITDRKKEVLKTSGGKMVPPQPIENFLKTDRYIGQAMVVGDRRKFIAALIVPNFEQIADYAAREGIPYSDVRDLVRRPEIVRLFAERVAEVNERLARYEQIKKFRLLDREFTLEAGEITPTLKYRRKVIEERYRDLIEEMYTEGPAAAV